jgi:hypothetical protein
LPATLGNWVTRFTDHLAFFEKPEHGLLISNRAENAVTWPKVLLIMKTWLGVIVRVGLAGFLVL